MTIAIGVTGVLRNALVCYCLQVQDIVRTGEVILHYQPEFRRSHVCFVYLNADLRDGPDGENVTFAS